MANGNINYSAVLADLEARKAQIESAITAVKTILASAGVLSNGTSEGVISPDDIPRGAFLRLSIADATKKYLDMVRTKQSVPQITQALERGGLPPAKTNTVYAVLRRRENDIGDIIRLGDEWALAEWYPNNPNLRRRTPEKIVKKAAKKRRTSKKSSAAPATHLVGRGLFEPTSIEHVTPAMTMLDAAEQVLLKSEGALHAKVIAERLVEYGKNTTASSLSGSLIQDTKKRFKNIGSNTWDLVERPEK